MGFDALKRKKNCCLIPSNLNFQSFFFIILFILISNKKKSNLGIYMKRELPFGWTSFHFFYVDIIMRVLHWNFGTDKGSPEPSRNWNTKKKFKINRRKKIWYWIKSLLLYKCAQCVRASLLNIKYIWIKLAIYKQHSSAAMEKRWNLAYLLFGKTIINNQRKQKKNK